MEILEEKVTLRYGFQTEERLASLQVKLFPKSVATCLKNNTINF